MGELVGLPEWLALTLWVVASLAICFGVAAWIRRRRFAALASRRPDPSREEFMALMAEDVSPQSSVFLWQTALPYVKPKLAPHPDDDLVENLLIDDGDLSMDWPREFATQQGFPESSLPDWPDGWPVTLRNFGRWLDRGRKGRGL